MCLFQNHYWKSVHCPISPGMKTENSSSYCWSEIYKGRLGWMRGGLKVPAPPSVPPLIISNSKSARSPSCPRKSGVSGLIISGDGITLILRHRYNTWIAPNSLDTRPPLGIDKSAECLSNERALIFANLDLVAAISLANRCHRLLLTVTDLWQQRRIWDSIRASTSLVHWKQTQEMVGAARFELATPAVWRQCSLK